MENFFSLVTASCFGSTSESAVDDDSCLLKDGRELEDARGDRRHRLHLVAENCHQDHRFDRKRSEHRSVHVGSR